MHLQPNRRRKWNREKHEMHVRVYAMTNVCMPRNTHNVIKLTDVKDKTKQTCCDTQITEVKDKAKPTYYHTQMSHGDDLLTIGQ